MPGATTMNPPRGDRRSKPCATRRRALGLLAVGLSRRSAARAVGVDPKTLRRWLAEAAERLPPPEPRSADDAD